MTTTQRRRLRKGQVVQMVFVTVPIVLAMLVLGASCGDSSGSGDDPGAGISAGVQTAASGAGTAADAPQPAFTKTLRVDPRDDGFEITMGEWAVAPEAKVIRPGVVTLVIANKGTQVHGFELKGESHDATDLEWRLMQPGETIRVKVRLNEGIYELECYVGEHDDMGMRAMLEVKRGAPLARRSAQVSGDTTVDITGFEYQPAVVTVKKGQTVRWVNNDAAPHTVTQQGGGFASKTLDFSSRFAMTFRRPGTYNYFCAVHPGMKATVIVKP